jgi:hypothetical protein
MSRRLLAYSILAVVSAAPAAPPVGARQSPDLSTVLAGRYFDGFARDFDGVVMREDYAQQGQEGAVAVRQLRSDLAVLADNALGWIEFRDTYEVDGRPVADRDRRIADLFEKPSASALEQARRIFASGARFNIGGVNRTINLPMATLLFLRGPNQTRSAFSRSGAEAIDGRQTIVVNFEERSRPRLIKTPDDAAASGTFWIEPDTGRIRRTMLLLNSNSSSGDVRARIRVDYADVPSLGLCLPRMMTETYSVSRANGVGVVSGRATYTNYRKFSVSVEEGPAAR